MAHIPGWIPYYFSHCSNRGINGISRPGFDPGQGYFFATASLPGPRHKTPPLHWTSGLLPTGKAAGTWNWPAPSSCAKVINVQLYLNSTILYVDMVLQCRDTFTSRFYLSLHILITPHSKVTHPVGCDTRVDPGWHGSKCQGTQRGIWNCIRRLHPKKIGHILILRCILAPSVWCAV